jgi:aryl-alcohol dehydrogenase-like predicted oxidoreductase
MSMETANVPDTGLSPSRVALGTWAIGGWMQGALITPRQSPHQIRDGPRNHADRHGPGGWFGKCGRGWWGRAEAGPRDSLGWTGTQAKCSATQAARIRKEVEDSLRRQRTDVIDFYQVRWPDPKTPTPAGPPRQRG